jgi:hypothetical protein
MLHPFFGPERRRVILPEIQAYIAERIDATPVYGFAEMIDAGDARCGGERISGFMERYELGEWLLPLTASKGMRWRTAPVPGTQRGHVAFALSLGFGNGSPLPQPSGQWDIYVNDRLAVSVRVVNHSQVWEAGECKLAFAANRLESAEPFGGLTLSSLIQNDAFATFGPAFLIVPSEWIEPGSPAEIRVEARSAVPSTRWLQLDVASALLEHADIYRLLDLLTQRHPRVGEYNVYFGDIHTHSGQVLDRCDNDGCGIGSREDNYRYALGPGGLDFYSLTDHEWQIGPAGIDEYFQLADTYNEDGRFVCLPAFEHTSLLYGHRNIYFRGPGGTVVNANRSWGGPTKDPKLSTTPAELWAALEATGVPFISVPHHPSAASHPFTLEYWSEHDRLVEVYSVWGSSEYYGDFPRGVSDRFRAMNVQDAIRRGLRFGLVASADGHDGHPGNAQSPLVKHHHQFHYCGSGRAAVFASELTREAIYDALYARRCYATTGAPILLDVRLNGAWMGQEVAPLSEGRRPMLTVQCVGSNGLDHIRIVKNGRIVYTQPCHGEWDCEVVWEDAAYDASRPNSYYVRVVQQDRESAWSSPIWLG